MTNIDKFREVFGLEPRTWMIPFKCNELDCQNCDALEYGCIPQRWWDSEYEENTYGQQT